MRIAIEGAIPMTTAPIVNSISAKIIVGFLPILSENGPPIKEPNAAPKVARETIVL